MKEQTKQEALAEFLECELDEVEVSAYDEDTFEAEGNEYLVLTDEEADQRAEDYIRDSAWAFLPGFIADHCPRGINADIISIIQTKYEDANEPILEMIECFDEFVNDAISGDGRGHFLSTYDGEEAELGEYFIYRTN